MAKIACVITEMFEDSEFMLPAEALLGAGHEIVKIEKQEGKVIKGKRGDVIITIDKSIDSVNPLQFDALLIPGGYSPDKLRRDNRFVKFTKHFMDNEKPVFAICHGPQLLITAKSLQGKTATGFESIAVDMEYAGAHYLDEGVVRDGQLITSRKPEDLPVFNREILKLLNQKQLH